MASEDRFGYEWDRYSDIYPEYEQQFLNWISPLDSEDFIGKDILDAGCGMGRNSYYALQYGAKYVTAFDAEMRSVQASNILFTFYYLFCLYTILLLYKIIS